MSTSYCSISTVYLHYAGLETTWNSEEDDEVYRVYSADISFAQFINKLLSFDTNSFLCL